MKVLKEGWFISVCIPTETVETSNAERGNVEKSLDYQSTLFPPKVIFTSVMFISLFIVYTIPPTAAVEL